MRLTHGRKEEVSLQQFKCAHRGMLRCLKRGPDSEPGSDRFGKSKCGRILLSGGVGAHIKEMVKAGKEADLVVAIDGCPTQCAAKTLQHVEIEPAIQVIVTQLGIEKSHDIAVDKRDCSVVVEKVKEENGL
jgi:uncharacterized metal-binding protein